VKSIELIPPPPALPTTTRRSRMSVYSVADELSARGWNLNLLQNPACLHICVTFANCGKADEFVADVKAAVEAVKAAPAGRCHGATGVGYMAGIVRGCVVWVCRQVQRGCGCHVRHGGLHPRQVTRV